jgi:hypothetical protein
VAELRELVAAILPDAYGMDRAEVFAAGCADAEAASRNAYKGSWRKVLRELSRALRQQEKTRKRVTK